MPVNKQRVDFLNSQAASDIKAELSKMAKSPKYNTEDSYTCSNAAHPDGKITFVEKHLQYIASHQDTNPSHYLANLKLKTRIN